MKVFGLFALVIAAVTFSHVHVEAGTTSFHGTRHHHEIAAHRLGAVARLARRKASGKCQAHFNKLYSSDSATKAFSTSSSSKAHSTSTTSHETTLIHGTTSSLISSHKTTPINHLATSTEANKLAAAPTGKVAHKSQSNGAGPITDQGLIQVSSDECGPSRATKEITHNSGPNGHEEWLDCGVRGGGWNPPKVGVSDLKVVSLSDSINSGSSPFEPCKDFIAIFNQYGKEFGIPPIMLASIAMQESSCNPGTVGGAGEQGLMQLTRDKCGGAPGSDCKEPHFNIRTGAKFFASLLDQNDGNVLLSVGNYNGWQLGMTIYSATAIKHQCCRCQNNLDYLQQFVNGWILGINAYEHNLGTFNNLGDCPFG